MTPNLARFLPLLPGLALAAGVAVAAIVAEGALKGVSGGRIALPGMVLGYCLIQFGVTWAYISGYVVSSEILPTRIRATGLGVSVAIGRLGAVIAPLMLTNVYAMSGSPSASMSPRATPPVP